LICAVDSRDSAGQNRRKNRKLRKNWKLELGSSKGENLRKKKPKREKQLREKA